MKRLLIALALVIAPALLAADAERAVLLTPEGVLYSVHSEGTDYAKELVLTVQRGENTTSMTVPATSGGGTHRQPGLAYDPESQTLFLFWLRSQNHILASSELIFCSFQNGKWNEPTAIDDAAYHFRYNLSVGVTNVIQFRRDDGPMDIDGLTVHVAWWDESGGAEVARYAMLTIEKGNVTARYVRDLPDMIERAFQRSFAPHPNSRPFIRQTAVFESPNHDTVDVVFGNAQTNTIHRVTLRPTWDTRVRIPIGVRESSFPAPVMKLGADANAHISTMPTAPDRLVFYTQEDGLVKYLKFQASRWAAPQSIAITDRVSASDAVSAIRKLVNGD
jgi:hypothetical protein